MTADLGIVTDVITLTVPGQPQYVGVARLAVSGVANWLDFPFDEAEDVKLAVTESCSHILRCAKMAIDLHLSLQFSRERLEIHIQSSVHEPRRAHSEQELNDISQDAELDVGMSLVEALMDSLSVEADEDAGTISVRMARALPSKKST